MLYNNFLRLRVIIEYEFDGDILCFYILDSILR